MSTEEGDDGTIDFIDGEDDAEEIGNASSSSSGNTRRTHLRGNNVRGVEIELGSIPVPTMKEEMESSTGEIVQSIEFQHGYGDLPISISSTVTTPSSTV